MSNSTGTLSPEFLSAYRGDELVDTAIAFIPIITIAVILRFYCRRLAQPEWGADDYMMFLALFCQIGSSVLSICGVKYAGSGYHLAALAAKDPENVVKFYKWLLADSFWYFLTVGIPKLAILCFYLRVFDRVVYRKIVYVLIAIVASNLIVTSIISLNLCRPFAYNWDHSISGSCYNQVVFYEWASFPNIVTDVAMLVLPMPVIWKLHTSTNMKIGLTFTFVLGSIGLCASIIRFNEFFHGNAIEDGSWTVQLPIWTMVEPNMYIIAGCLMTYHPLLRHIRVFGSRIKTTIFSGGHSGHSNKMSSSPGSSKRNATAEQKPRSSFLPPMRRKMRRHDLESLGNSFDMKDTQNEDFGEANDKNRDDVRLVSMATKSDSGVTANKETPIDLPTNQIRVQNEYDVRSDSRETIESGDHMRSPVSGGRIL